MSQKIADFNSKTKWNEANQFDMIRPKKLNNVEYWQIKSNKLFDLDQKSRIKTNSYSFLLFVNVQ